MATGLTPKEVRFVEEYLVDPNATQSAKLAGFSKKTAKSQGQRLLKKPRVAAAIKKARDERSKRMGITAEWVIDQLRNLANANILDFLSIDRNGLATIDLSNMTREQAAAVRVVKTTETVDGKVIVDLKLADPKPALELLGRHLGMFTTKHEITGPGGGPIEIVDPDSLDLARRIAFLLTTAQKQGKENG